MLLTNIVDKGSQMKYGNQQMRNTAIIRISVLAAFASSFFETSSKSSLMIIGGFIISELHQFLSLLISIFNASKSDINENNIFLMTFQDTNTTVSAFQNEK